MIYEGKKAFEHKNSEYNLEIHLPLVNIYMLSSKVKDNEYEHYFLKYININMLNEVYGKPYISSHEELKVSNHSF